MLSYCYVIVCVKCDRLSVMTISREKAVTQKIKNTQNITCIE